MKKQLLLSFILFISIAGFSQIHIGNGQTYANLSDATTAKAIHAGDTVYLHAGTYTAGQWIPDTLMGTASQWITIRPYKNDSVSITAQWTFQNLHYVKFYGLNWDGTDPTNIGHMLFFDYEYNCFTTLTHIIVDNCKFMNDNQASSTSFEMIKFTGTDSFQVSNCLFKNSINIADGLSMNGCHNGTITNCRFENLNSWAGHCKGGSQNITFQKSMIINCAGGGFVMGGDTGGPYYCSPGPTYEASYIHFYSNIVVGGPFGIRLGSCCYSDVVNNTCYNMTTFAVRVLMESSNSPNFSNNSVINNIIASDDPYGCYINASGGVDYSTFYFQNNLYWDYSSVITAPNFEGGSMTGLNVSGSVVGDPLFTNAAMSDFSLQSGSPAKGAGMIVSNPVSDYYGNNYNTATPSIGAVEYADLLSVKNADDAYAVSIYPNPSADDFTVSWQGVGSLNKVDVYNANGQLVSSLVPSSYLFTLKLQGLAKGIYKAVCHTSGGSVLSRTLVMN